ncbi:streptophobe family protein [Streptomyces ziwulingensis]
MSAPTSTVAQCGPKAPWTDVVLSAIAAVSWALIGMAGTAALGLRLLEADFAGSLGPMTAAVVALGAGGSVTPSGEMSAFGLEGAEARTAIEIAPLGVGLAGALLLSFFFLRSLRASGAILAPAELLARAGTTVALFVAMTGGLAWAGHGVVTIDGGALGLDGDLSGGGGGVEIPGLGDVGDIGDVGGLSPDRIGDLVDAEAAVGFTVDTGPTLLGGLGWCAGVLLIALLASRRTPLPRGWDAVHRVVRPAGSALVAVALLAVAAGWAAAAYAAIGDDHPRRIAGAALLGAPNGGWLGVGVGLFVPWDGRATGASAGLLPGPLDDLLSTRAGEPVTVGRLAELDGRVWLLAVAAALVMLLAGVLTAVRTPVGPLESVGRVESVGFAGRCALRLGIATASALPLLVWLTEVSVNASLSVLGIETSGAATELSGRLATACLLGAGWGAGAGAAGALLARATGAAGRRAAPLAVRTVPPAQGDGIRRGALSGLGGGDGRRGGALEPSGPYRSGTPYRPPDPGTNPYSRAPDGPHGPGPEDRGQGPGNRQGSDDHDDGAGAGGAGVGGDGVGGDDIYGAPTVAGPVTPLPRRPPGARARPPPRRPARPPPPPPPPPAPPRPPRRPDHRG